MDDNNLKLEQEKSTRIDDGVDFWADANDFFKAYFTRRF